MLLLKHSTKPLPHCRIIKCENEGVKLFKTKNKKVESYSFTNFQITPYLTGVINVWCKDLLAPTETSPLTTQDDKHLLPRSVHLF